MRRSYPTELFFSILTRRLLRRGEFTSRQDLADKIMHFIEVYDRTAKPFRWTYDGSPFDRAQHAELTNPALVRVRSIPGRWARPVAGTPS
jgi:hypothetical protein